MLVKLHYRKKELGKAWATAFKGISQVHVLDADILETGCDALVSPANSFGFMDGGLDRQLSEKFGWDLQNRVQEEIRKRPMKELLVGEAIIVPAGSGQAPWLVCAPTMRVPINVKTSVNAYLAMKAILLAAKGHNSRPLIRTLAVPGLGTGVGGLLPQHCAVQMATAYKEVILGEYSHPPDFGQAQKEQLRLNDSAMIHD